MALYLVGGAIVGFLLCLVGVLFISKSVLQKKVRGILDEARQEGEKIILNAQAKAEKLKRAAELEIQEERNESKQFEKRLLKKEDVLERRIDAVQSREKFLEKLAENLEQKQKAVESKAKEIENIINKEEQILRSISGLSKEDATKIILDKLDAELSEDKAKLLKKRLDEIQEISKQESTKILLTTMARYAGEITSETVVTSVELPNDEMKGRIIGREGRNIKTFERITGVDVIVDDTPNTIVLSAFDGVRREMALRSMGKLILDGRIHPARIEEIVEKTKKELEEDLVKVGRDILFELNIHNVNPKLIILLGRLKYRTSYGQSVLQHSIEVARFASTIASELNLDSKLAQRCGIFHDIGKAVDQEMEGSHPFLGCELLKRCQEHPAVIDAAARHHEDANASTPYTVITAIADTISASRPGARGESIEHYLKRMETLERIAKNFSGVESAYAIYAGREIRVIINPEKIDDNQSIILASNIAKEIEKELNYPGEIKVTVIREKRVIEYAR